MDNVPLIVTIFTCLLFIVGFAGIFLPVIPGTGFIWLGLVIHKIWVPDASVSWTFVIVSGLLVILGHAAEWAAGFWGARRFGSTWRGALGATLGGVFGIFIPPFPLFLILGPIIGATVGELVAGKPWRQASRAGLGAFVGGVLALLFKIGIALFMILGFFLTRD